MKNAFYSNVLRMCMGTIGAYVFWALAMVLVARLYGPGYFGEGQLVVSAASILSVVATGRYEKALMLPKAHSQAVRLLMFSISLSVIFSVFVFVMCVGASGIIGRLTGIVSSNLYFVPFYMLEICLYMLSYAWMIRMEKYTLASQGLVLFSLSYLAFCAILYFIPIPIHRLILAIILARGVEILWFFYHSYLDIWACVDEFSLHDVIRTGGEYADFPKYVLSGSLIEVASVQIIPFLVVMFYGMEATGYYSMAVQICAAPQGLIAKSVGDVFRQEGARLYGQYHKCSDFYRRTLLLCLGCWGLFGIGIYFAVPIVVPFFLGEKWIVAGHYLQRMFLMTSMLMVSMPLLDMYVIARQQKKYIFIQAGFLASSIVGIGVVGKMGYDIEAAFLTWGLLAVFMTCVCVYGGWDIASGDKIVY